MESILYRQVSTSFRRMLSAHSTEQVSDFHIQAAFIALGFIEITSQGTRTVPRFGIEDESLKSRRKKQQAIRICNMAYFNAVVEVERSTSKLNRR